MRTMLKTEKFRIDRATGQFTVAILYNGSWHETSLTGSYEEILEAAYDAARRSRLTVQVRDSAGEILEEISDTF